MGFPDDAVVKNLPANAGAAGDSSFIPGSGRSPGGGNGNPLQILAQRIPWTEEPGGLLSMGSHRVRHDWSDLAAAAYILDSILKSRDITLLTKVHIVKSMASPVAVWELDHKESWVLKNCCFWTVVLEKILESPWDCKDIKPVHPKGDQSWVCIGRTSWSWNSKTLAT